MKVVIVGGGIAGLMQGILLRQKGHEVVVYERTQQIQTRGHAFLINGEGIDYLESLISEEKTDLHYNKVDVFSLKRPDDFELIKISLDDWYSMKRIDLIQFLVSFYTKDNLKFGFEFSHFQRTNDKVSSVVFKNGHNAEADIFIGADGSNSLIRKTIFGEIEYTSTSVKEVVGISSYHSQSELSVFQKYQSNEKGLAFGSIPLNDKECVWFMQYDRSLEKNEIHQQEELREFCLSLLGDFPQEVQNVLNLNDFTNSYIWNTRDFDLLPSFHKENVVLIGDAAHLALPFTSAGTSNAIKDAITLSELISEMNLEETFSTYYNVRKQEIASHIQQGRDLKKIFLNPDKYSERGYILPLVSDKYSFKKKNSSVVQISYFTDPICSSCWLLQPILRKLKLEYDTEIQIEYFMGGLLPSWESYSDKRITSPADASKLWEEISEAKQIPISGDVWLNDPLSSSFPPSIAFKAAQLQDIDKAVFFLRRLKEMIFIEKKNINNWINIEKAALDCGLDAALLKNQLKEGEENFYKDLALAEQLNIHVFPTLIFNIAQENPEILKGLQSYEMIEKTIRKYIPNVVKNELKPTPLDLFKMFNNMSTKEFCFLLDLDEIDGINQLHELEKKSLIGKITIKRLNQWYLISVK
jgi:2-polyprenyl-6-methoxyphenol hydroxylase-like FAD-dependent oxidoreductase/predicted DsbA family dithiol-disulfide isomerase